MNEFIYGYQPVREILKHQPQIVQKFYMQRQRADERAEELLNWAQAAKKEVVWVSRAELDKLLGTTQHQGMAIQCSRISAFSEALLTELLVDESQPVLLLILDGYKTHII